MFSIVLRFVFIGFGLISIVGMLWSSSHHVFGHNVLLALSGIFMILLALIPRGINFHVMVPVMGIACQIIIGIFIYLQVESFVDSPQTEFCLINIALNVIWLKVMQPVLPVVSSEDAIKNSEGGGNYE